MKVDHETTNYGSAEKSILKLNETYWFPTLSKYLDGFIKCCVACLFAKRKRGNTEGFLHPILKSKIPLQTIHTDHLRPFVATQKKLIYNCSYLWSY